MKAIGNSMVYEGLVVIDEDGTTYREVTEEDIRSGKPVFEIRLPGLEYVSTVSAVAKLVRGLHLQYDPLTKEDHVKWAAKPPFDLIGSATVKDFTGQSRQKGVLPETAYFVRLS